MRRRFAPIPDLTVFVGTYNRVETLQRTIDSHERQHYPHRLVIVDNGSDDPRAIDLLRRLERRHTVYRLKKVGSMAALTFNFDRAIRREWAEQTRPRWYAVTDADVCLEWSRDSIGACVELAYQLSGHGVGVHLRPSAHRNYPLRTRVMVEQTWFQYRSSMLWKNGIPYSPLPIDTTFHVFKAEPRHRRLQMSTVRVGAPYWATHLDWEIDVCNPNEENLAYMRDEGPVGSWGKGWIRHVFNAYQRSPEEAFHLIAGERNHQDDYWNDGFMLSWMFQYGHGTEASRERSEVCLRASLPQWSLYWQRQFDWPALVYDNDLSPLGWGEEEK